LCYCTWVLFIAARDVTKARHAGAGPCMNGNGKIN
jgi:hypothetical protein